HSPKGSKYEVQFPGKPKVNPVKDGEQLLLEAREGKAVYFIQSSTLAKEIKPDDPLVKTIFDNTRDALEKSLKGKVTAEKDIKLGDAPGRTFDVDAPGLGIYRTQIYISKAELIQVVVAGPKEFVDSEEAKKFLGSLKMTK